MSSFDVVEVYERLNKERRKGASYTVSFLYYNMTFGHMMFEIWCLW